MTKHVEIWTLSKESRVVPYMTDVVELYEYYPPPDVYVSSGVLVDKVERRYMSIIQVTKHEKLYTSLGGTVPNRIDKYVAIHPDVDEAISVKWKERVDEVEADNISLLRKYYTLFDSVEAFKLLPWYKRVWRALWKTL